MSEAQSPTPAPLSSDQGGRLAPESGAAMNEKIERFFEEQGRRWADTTRRSYRWYLADLAKWLEGREADNRLLVRWLDARIGWSTSTQYTAVVACRAFFRWSCGREASPAEKLILPRRVRKPQRTLDELRLMRILGALDTSTAKGVRDTAIVLLLLDTGLRAAEVCRLRMEHVDMAERRFSVRVKGGKWAEGVFAPYTASSLVEWLMVRKDIAKVDTPEVFVGIGGKTPGRKLTAYGLKAIFRTLGQKVGFHFSPHDFRRTFATLSLKGGAPSRLVQVAGRWSSLEQVERYSAAITADDFEPYSPVHRVLGLRPGAGKP